MQKNFVGVSEPRRQVEPNWPTLWPWEGRDVFCYFDKDDRACPQPGAWRLLDSIHSQKHGLDRNGADHGREVMNHLHSEQLGSGAIFTFHLDNRG